MLDVILIICVIILVIGGIAYLVLPAEKIVKKEKLKDGETFEEATKKARKSGILYIVLGILLFLFNFVL